MADRSHDAGGQAVRGPFLGDALHCMLSQKCGGQNATNCTARPLHLPLLYAVKYWWSRSIRLYFTYRHSGPRNVRTTWSACCTVVYNFGCLQYSNSRRTYVFKVLTLQCLLNNSHSARVCLARSSERKTSLRPYCRGRTLFSIWGTSECCHLLANEKLPYVKRELWTYYLRTDRRSCSLG